ncbi:MAG TPA: 30S ribosomal protein S16 [Actinomycetota bacterium]|nr:30S ribosomal protein S16 [Actinomycetota bacterium]
MATRIRLRRMGSNKRPFYRVVVADQRAPRDGRFIEAIGKYHPLNDPSLIEIDEERALHWLRVGAQPSGQVRNLMSKVGIWERFVSERPSALKGLKPAKERTEKVRLSKKAQAKAAGSASTQAPGEPTTPEGSDDVVPTDEPGEQPASPSEAEPGAAEQTADGAAEAGED